MISSGRLCNESYSSISSGLSIGCGTQQLLVNLEGGKEKNEGKVGGKETRPGS